jgi:hypothetical protein
MPATRINVSEIPDPIETDHGHGVPVQVIEVFLRRPAHAAPLSIIDVGCGGAAIHLEQAALGIAGICVKAVIGDIAQRVIGNAAADKMIVVVEGVLRRRAALGRILPPAVAGTGATPLSGLKNHQWEVGLSLPNLILGQTGHSEKQSQFSGDKDLAARRSQLAFIEPVLSPFPPVSHSCQRRKSPLGDLLSRLLAEERFDRQEESHHHQQKNKSCFRVVSGWPIFF